MISPEHPSALGQSYRRAHNHVLARAARVGFPLSQRYAQHPVYVLARAQEQAPTRLRNRPFVSYPVSTAVRVVVALVVVVVASIEARVRVLGPTEDALMLALLVLPIMGMR